MENEQRADKKHAHLIAMVAMQALVLAALACLFLQFQWRHEDRGVIPLVTGWRYFTQDAPEPVDIPMLEEYIPVEPGQTLTMIRTMQEHAQGAAIFLHLDSLYARVFLGDGLIFSNEDDPPGPDKGFSYRLISLPDDYLGQELTVEVSSPYALYSFSPDIILFGSAQALMAHAIAEDAGDIVLMFVLVFSGLLLMSFSLFQAAAAHSRASDLWADTLFGLFSVLFGVFLPAGGPVFAMAFSPSATALLYHSMWHLSLVPMIWFMVLKCGRTRPTMLALAALYSLTVLGAGAWVLLFSPTEVLTVMNPAVIAMALITLVLGGYEWSQKNPFFRMTASAFLVLGAAGVLSAIDIQGFHTPKELLRIGGLVLLSALVWADILRTSIRVRRKSEEERQLLLLTEVLAAEQLAASEVHSKETRLLHHEIRHHMAALMVLQRAGDLAAIGAYLQKMDTIEQALEEIQYCEHPLVNAILAKTGRDCTRDGIRYECEANVPAGIPIADADLSTLLMNMLENAAEAARQADSAQRWLHVKIRVRDDYLVISCTNAHLGDIRRQGDQFLSTKHDARFHGYGVLAMRKIAHRYGSKLNIDYNERSFSVKTILRLSDE